jgi:TolB-like protein
MFHAAKAGGHAAKLRTEKPLPASNIARPAGQTQAGMVIGTVKYMSPEQAQGLVLDRRSDLFAVGVVIYEMLAGAPPFGGESTDEVIAEILTMDPPALSDFAPEVRQDLEHMVGKALRKDREARYQAAKDLLVDLQLLQKELEFEANLQRAGYVDVGGRRSRPSTGRHGVAPALPEPQRATPQASVVPSVSRPRRMIFALLLVLIAVVATALLGKHFGWMRTVTNSEAALPRTMAVLPFRNLNQDPQMDFLQFSLADAVITKLSYVKALIVRPSSSIEQYRNRSIDLRGVAAQLHVDTLLTGAFIREGKDLRITTQLIDVKSNTILWRETLDVTYDKLLTVQDRVAQQIIDGLSLKLSPAETERIHFDRPANTTAYEYYLRGVDLYALNEFDQAIDMLHKSIALEPNYMGGSCLGYPADILLPGRSR